MLILTQKISTGDVDIHKTGCAGWIIVPKLWISKIHIYTPHFKGFEAFPCGIKIYLSTSFPHFVDNVMLITSLWISKFTAVDELDLVKKIIFINYILYCEK